MTSTINSFGNIPKTNIKQQCKIKKKLQEKKPELKQ